MAENPVSPDPERIAIQADFGRELTALRERARLTIRDIARASGIPVSTTGDYFSGRHLPVEPQQLIPILLACGETDPTRIAQWEAALRRARRSSGRQTEFSDLVAEAVRAERATAVEDLGREATLWLAVVPLWTRGAAEAAGFPAPSVIEFVKRARDVGWCETRGSLHGQGAANLRFWMPDEPRRDVLDLLSRRAGPEPLIREAKRIAGLIERAWVGLGSDARTTLPRTLVDWAELITDKAPDQALIDWVRQAVGAQDLSGAQQLVAAGDSLAALLAGTTELAVDRARRLLNLGTRQRQDDRALEHYLDRPELSDAVTRLLRPGTADWALHLRGAGGSGKTMLIRYLASGRYAAERGLPSIPVARVDFDHMSPDYPVRRPVQLLLELADELALHTAAVSRADRALRRFRASAASVHESLSSVREERPTPMQNPQVLAAIDDFAAAVAELPEVLLILDTCEELAKADSGDPAAPAVRTTLAIMERISAGAPSVRVLFAGRRPLPHRDYLKVRDVTGFTVDEARRYLATFSARPLPADLADAMIRQSPAVDAPVLARGEMPDRVSPFDLALYSSWADEDPGLDVARIEQGSDAYIEGRIIERINDPHVLRALPVLACVGRCRISTIASFVADDAAVVGPRLAEQEWIDADGDPPLHVAAKPALARRLRRYFSASERAAGFITETARLAQALRREVQDAQLVDIDVDELLAALRLSEPAAAARLWDDIVDRAVAGGRWGWLLNVTRRVRGESEEEGWPTADALRATVLASFIAASRRAFPSFNARAAWGEVFAWASSHPDEETGQFLRARAALGILPYTPDDALQWAALDAGISYPYRSPARATALMAVSIDTAHRLLDAGANDAAVQIFAKNRLYALLADGPDRERPVPVLIAQGGARVQAWAFVAAARLNADEKPSFAREALIEADYQATIAAREPDAEPAWADWIPPDNLLARVRIEHGLIAPSDDRLLEAWETYAADNLDTTDGERLASLCLRLRLGRGVIRQSVIEKWEAADRYDSDRVATCSAHDLVPPLFATLAEAWLAAGVPGRALDILERRRAAALDSRGDDATVRIADAETVRVARRLRLDDQRALLSRLSTPRDSDPTRLALTDSARRAMAVIYGEPPPRKAGTEVSQRPEGWHAWWQCLSNVRAPIPPVGWPSDSTSADLAADIELDLEEMRLLEHPALQELQERLADWLAKPRPARRVRSTDPYREVRTGLREAALAGAEPYDPPPDVDVPPRLLAEMAFDEAELLAPRLPAAASRLFGYAEAAYSASGDFLGRLLALSSLIADGVRPSPRTTLQAARAQLQADKPSVAAALTENPADAGPWRHWAEFLQQLDATEHARTAPKAVSWAASVLGGIEQVFSTLTLAGYVIVFGLLAFNADPRYFILGVLSLVAVVVGAVIASGAWRVRSVLRLAASQGVDVFSPETMGLTALIQYGAAQLDRGRVYLWADVRPLQTAPRRAWARLAVLALAGALLSIFRRGDLRSGYAGRFREPSLGEIDLSWDAGPPKASSEWWSRGTAVGMIFVNLTDGTQPWERIITQALGPNAAGRIEWYRRLSVLGVWSELSDPHDSAVVELDAPPEWLRYLNRFYETGAAAHVESPESLAQVRHAIGRAVSTSAGPRLDISGESTDSSSARDLLGSEDLSRGRPSLIVLQAEPVSEDSEADTRDDLLEKLALAADLIAGNATRQVLIVPALSVRHAENVARAIGQHAAARPRIGARALQAELRRLLGPDVEPAVLDDLVLFVNVRE